MATDGLNTLKSIFIFSRVIELSLQKTTTATTTIQSLEEENPSVKDPSKKL